MFECENGHIFHEACVKDVNLDSPEIRKAYMLDVLKKSIENCTKYLEEGSSREYYTRRLADSKSELAQLEAGEFDEDTIYDMCDEWEFRYSAPEGVCPVCTMQTFDDFDIRKYIFKKYEIDTDELKKEIKEKFKTYTEFKASLRD